MGTTLRQYMHFITRASLRARYGLRRHISLGLQNRSKVHVLPETKRKTVYSRAFTIVEVLIGIGVVVILAVVGVVAYSALTNNGNGYDPDSGKPYTAASCFEFEDNTTEITRYYDKENENMGRADCPRDVVIPREIDGAPVTHIGSGAFRGSNLTSVTIPNSVTSIGFAAFDSNELTAVDIPNSVTSIDSTAFRDNQLTSVTIPDSITMIDSATFDLNQLTSVTIPNSVTRIGINAFRDNKLTSVTIPGSVTWIGAAAFSKNQLSSIVIPDSVTSIGVNAFQDNRLTSVSLPGTFSTGGKQQHRDFLDSGVIVSYR